MLFYIHCYTKLLKKPDTFHLLQTREEQIIEQSRYAYLITDIRKYSSRKKKQI